jgi:hypothetical protein
MSNRLISNASFVLSKRVELFVWWRYTEHLGKSFIDGPYNKVSTVKTSGSREVYNEFHAHFSSGVAGPMIHHLLTWTLLILAPEAVEGQFLASVLAGMGVGRCGRPTSKSWDEPTLLGDAQNALGSGG